MTISVDATKVGRANLTTDRFGNYLLQIFDKEDKNIDTVRLLTTDCTGATTQLKLFTSALNNVLSTLSDQE